MKTMDPFRVTFLDFLLVTCMTDIFSVSSSCFLRAAFFELKQYMPVTCRLFLGILFPQHVSGFSVGLLEPIVSERKQNYLLLLQVVRCQDVKHLGALCWYARL